MLVSLLIYENQLVLSLMAIDSPLAFSEPDGNIKTFGLDRISNLMITDTKFKPIPYNIEKTFQHAFGVVTNEAAVKIILEFSWQQGNYMKSFPLHESQSILEDNEDRVLIELFIHPTNDFIMELLKYGEDVKVLEPQSLIDTMKNRIEKVAKLYQ